MTQIKEARAQAPGPDIAPLLQPLEIGRLRLRNRFVLPGMQRAWTVDGAPTARMREYYRQRALGGTALVITEACAVDHTPSGCQTVFVSRVAIMRSRPGSAVQSLTGSRTTRLRFSAAA
ncbi:MAG: hypothetical protein WAL12_09020, partial [Trebonia sp.]